MQFNAYKTFTQTFEAVERWHSRTAPEYRTIDNLVSYLQRNNYSELGRNYKDNDGKIKPITFKTRKRKKENIEKDKKEAEEFLQLFSFRSLGGYLQCKNLDFKLTPRLVDSVLHPKMAYPDLQWGHINFS